MTSALFARSRGAFVNGIMRIVVVGLLVAGVAPLRAHDEDLNRPPTKAGKEIAAARKLLDTAKRKLLAAGRYSCCVKPPPQSKVTGCDWCARTVGSCKCGANMSEGKGVCGDCVGGWKRGEGLFPGIDRKSVKLLPAPAQKMDGPETPDPPELVEARETLIKAKRILVQERRFVCCIKQGGCDECALEAGCPCAVATQNKQSKGVCSQCYDGWHAGAGRVAGLTPQEIKFNPVRGNTLIATTPFAGLSILQEGSGTSWQPEASPMFATMRDFGRWGGMAHYNVFFGYDRQEGERGDYAFPALNQVMFQGRRFVPDGQWVLAAMFSLDALTATPAGYPLLFQGMREVGGAMLTDRREPNDFFMELSARYRHKLNDNSALFLYFAPVGEPALGPVTYLHRTSGLDNPMAPVGHHQQDSSHIRFGVATLGAWWKSVQLEASVFTGREPDEHRWNFDPMRFDSFSGRLTWNPSRNWSLQTSYGYLHSPMAMFPDEDMRRSTASAMYVLRRGDGGFWATTFAWGRNSHGGMNAGMNLDSYLLETSLNIAQRHTVFGRFEYAQKMGEELDVMPMERVFGIGQFTLGYVFDFTPKSPFQTGIGAAVTWNAIPAELEEMYGRSPMGWWVFVRVRPRK